MLDFRGANVGGAVVPGRLVRGNIQTLVREPRIAFLVHGYNVNRAAGRNSLDAFASSLRSQTGTALVATLWPGDHWARFASYPFEGKDADDSAHRLAAFIRAAFRTAGTRVSFVSHSMGARVVLETIKRLQDSSIVVEQVCLMAPAVDSTCLADPKAYAAAAAKCDRVAVLSSTKDRVLKLAYPAGDLLQSLLYPRTDDAGFALGYGGPKDAGLRRTPANVIHWPVHPDRGADHGHYLPPLAGDGGQADKNRTSAASYADDVLAGRLYPNYP